MRNIVKALRAIGYQVTISRLSDEDKAVWGNMVASATSQQQVTNLLPEETAWWNKEVDSESCTNCAFNGQQFCYKHN